MSKRLSIYDDPQLPSGSVVIAVTPPELDPAQASVSIIRRNADRPHLGPFGWQASEHAFQPLQVRDAGGHTELVFGTELSRHLAVDMDLVVTIPAAGIRERQFWPDIATALGDASLLLDMPERRPINRPDQRPSQGGAGGLGNEVPSKPNETDRAIIDDPDFAPTDEPSKPDKTKRVALVSALAALVCLALAVGLYLYLSPSDSERGEELQATTTPADTATPAPAPVTQDTSPRVEETPPPPSAQNFASRYREYLDQQGHAEELLSLGHEALSANETDVGFNAVTLSADRGSAAAKYLMGQWYDPLSLERQLVTASANNAAVYYGEAAAGGSEEARSALKKLCDAAAVTAAPAPGWTADFDRKTHCQ